MKERMKKFFVKNRKAVIVILIISLSFGVVLGSVGIASEVVFAKKCKLGEEMIYGEVEEYEWKSSDHFDIEDYPSITVKDGKIKVLALADTHLQAKGKYAPRYLWAESLIVERAYKDIDKLIRHTKPDLIVLVGDLFTDPLSDIVMEDIRDFLDSYAIPWTLTFGNHDGEWRADKAALCNIIKKSPYTVFQPGPTNLQGLGNSIVNFKDEQGNVFYSLITMDTGDWQKLDDIKINFRNIRLDKSDREFATEDVGYTDEQAEWYEWIVNGLKEENNDEIVETMVVSHIAFKGYGYAIELADEFIYNPITINPEAEDYYETPERHKNPQTKEEKQEAYEDYKENYPFFNAVTKLGSTKNFISGHIHSFGYSVEYDGIIYTSITKTTDIYISHEWDHGKRGGTYFEISQIPIASSHVTKNQPVYIKEVKKKN